jgi:TM2 domain-containing membrane protein YozV
MNCAVHTDVPAVAYCRTCGKALCENCKRDVMGAIYCEPCIAVRLHGTQPAAAIPVAPVVITNAPSPGVAMLLGFIPGVGAMYNGQFMKGFIHVMAFVCMIWMADRFGPIMVPVFFAYFFYLVFDAYKTAHAIELGQPLPDPFGFERMFGPTVQPGRGAATMSSGTQPFGSGYEPSTASPDVKHRSSVPTGAVILIALGVLFLLHTVGWFEFGIDRFWPVILIAFGGWLFAKRWGLLGTEGLACTCDRCKMRCIMWPSIMITLGVLFLMDNLHGPGFERTWPLVLLVIGAVKLLQSNASEAGHVGGPPALPPQAPPPVPPASDPNASIPSSGEVNHV